MNNVNTFEMDAVSLRSLLQDDRTPLSSARSSFQYSSLSRHECKVSIYDQHDGISQEAALAFEPQEKYTANFRLPHASPSVTLPNDLKQRLDERDPTRTRWINVEGWSPGLVDDITNRFLENHGCLDLEDLGPQTLGGPIHCKDGSSFIWIQTSLWYAGQRSTSWSSVRQCRLRIVICLPTQAKAGTVITNFLGRPKLAEEVCQAYTHGLLSSHAMGTETLSCVWILASSILRLSAEQLDLAFHVFDPLERADCTVPQMSDLDQLRQSANNLARIDRYVSCLGEIASFFESVRLYQQGAPCTTYGGSKGPKVKSYSMISPRSQLESALAREKIKHAQQICETYIKQYESRMKLVSPEPQQGVIIFAKLQSQILSDSTAQIIHRMDSGQQLGERLATIGLVLAAVSFLSTPFVMVTGYFGMNVRELIEETTPTMFEFWQTTLPFMAVSIGLLIIVFLRLISKNQKLLSLSSKHGVE